MACGWKKSPHPAHTPPSIIRFFFSSSWAQSAHQYWPLWSLRRFLPATSAPHLQQIFAPAVVVLGMTDRLLFGRCARVRPSVPVRCGGLGLAAGPTAGHDAAAHGT